MLLLDKFVINSLFLVIIYLNYNFRLFQVKSFLKLKNTSAINAKLAVSIIEEKIETAKFGEEELHDKTDLETVKQFLKKNKIIEGQHRLLNALHMMKADRSLTDFMSSRILEYSSSVFSFESFTIDIKVSFD